MLKIVRYFVSGLCLTFSLAAIFYFDWILKQFMFLSPDNTVVPLMRILFQLVLVSLGSVGLVLILSGPVIRLLALVDSVISRLDKRTFLIYTLGAACLLRLAAVLFMPFHQFYDYKGYDEYGWEWAQKGGYYRGEHPTAFWPPGYPFLLSRVYILFGHVPQAAAAVNVLLGVSILLLTYFIMRKIWDEKTARWAAVILAFFPSQIIFSHLLASEFLFTPLMLLSILLFLSFDRKLTGRWYLIALGGMVLGMATLTRVISKLLLVLVILYWWWESRDFGRTVRYGLLAVSGFLLVIVPWMVRNHYAVGAGKINTNTGINLFIGNQPTSGMGYQQYLADEFDGQNPLYEAYTDSAAWDRAWEYIFDHPGVFLYRGVIKVSYLYASDMDPLWYGLIEATERPETNYAVFLSLFAQSYYLLVLLAAALGLVAFFRSGSSLRNPGGFLLVGILLYWTGIHFVFYGLGRYHFPILPMIAAFAALFVRNIIEKKGRA